MNKKLWSRTGLLLVIASFACNLQGTATLPPPSRLCSPNELVAPVPSFPIDSEVVPNLTPTFRWKVNDPVLYPLDAVANCIPLNFHVRLLEGPAFESGQKEDTAIAAGGVQDSLTFAQPLKPATEYKWTITGFAIAANAIVDGPSSGQKIFFTGPECDQNNPPQAPVPDKPTSGSQVNTLRPVLSWTFPNACLPRNVGVDLSTDQSFASQNLGRFTSNPISAWTPAADLVDCTLYYWRVQARNGYVTGDPYARSDVQSFFVNVSGACPTPASAAPNVTPTSTATEGPAGFTLSENANCRTGPSQDFSAATSYFKGEILVMDGRNEDTTWLHAVRDRCWISMFTGIYNGDPKLLPVIEVALPPTPKPTKTPRPYNSCGDYTTEKLCKADPMNFGCNWDSPTCYSNSG